MTSTHTYRAASPVGLAAGSAGLALVVLLAATAAYINVAEPILTDARVLGYPAVWITTSIAAAVWIGRTVRARPYRRRGLLVAGGYTLALWWLAGVIGAPVGTGTTEIIAAVPGWGPIVIHDGVWVRLAIVPFKLVAYLALGYVVYVFVAASGGSGRAAILGFGTCVSCTAPLLLAVVGLIGGGQAATMAASVGYDIATLLLVVTFGLLVRAASRHTPGERERGAETPSGGEP